MQLYGKCLYACVAFHLALSLHYSIALNNPQKVKSFMLIAPQYKMPKLLLGIQNIVFRILPQAAFGSMGFSKKDIIALATSMKKIDFTSLLNEVACPAFIICGQKDRANQNAAKNIGKYYSKCEIVFR